MEQAASQEEEREGGRERGALHLVCRCFILMFGRVAVTLAPRRSRHKDPVGRCLLVRTRSVDPSLTRTQYLSPSLKFGTLHRLDVWRDEEGPARVPQAAGQSAATQVRSQFSIEP
jgi:hypothetical protein